MLKKCKLERNKTMEKTITLKKYKECKNSVRYNSLGEDCEYIMSVYVMKTHLPKPYPDTVTITIKA